jgi:ABC-type transport system involved in multi-copper enzyme maturation permease subunit
MPIFDQGYQHWRGPLSGRMWRWWTIAKQGVRVQMLSRNVRVLMILSWVPALALVTFMALWGLVEKKSEGILAFVRNILPADVLTDPLAYREPIWTLAFSNFFKTQMFFIMLLVAICGRGLISTDLRFNALPLYFARPLTRFDYFLGKLGVIGALVASVAVGPAVLAYVVGVFFSLDPGVIKVTWKVLLGSIVYGLVVTLSAGTLVLAISSLSRRSLYVACAWVGLWIISGSVAAPLTEEHRFSLRQTLYDEEMDRWEAEHPAPPGVRVQREFMGRGRGPRPVRAPQPMFRRAPGQGLLQNAGNDGWVEQREKASQEAQLRVEQRWPEEIRKDWRPLCSYVNNLERIEEQLLDTDSAWVTFGKASVKAGRMMGAAPGEIAGPANERFLADQFVPQFPWQWSAGVLAGLLGISLWILTTRVKSLDRLK